MKYAEIWEGRVRHIGTAPTLPEFRPPLFAVDVTALDPEPKEHWKYSAGTFTPAEPEPAPPLDPAIQAAKALLAKDSWSPADTNQALKFLLKNALGGR